MTTEEMETSSSVEEMSRIERELYVLILLYCQANNKLMLKEEWDEFVREQKMVIDKWSEQIYQDKALSENYYSYIDWNYIDIAAANKNK
jgi:hypothetical protein